MSQTPWEKTKVYSKRGFDKAWNTLDKLGPPVNRLSNKVGAEAFWPTTLDKESDKAARILRSFCKDGFYTNITDEEVEEQLRRGVAREDLNMPRGKQRVVKKIPASVIKEAKGLAIFTTMRTGLWVSGSGGSGVLVARNQETGEWSPPSGIMTQTIGLGFLVGVDVYDCVVVINTYEALESFKSFRCTLGGEVAAMAGPVGVGGVLDTEVHKRQAPIWTYIKGRGFYAGVEIAGTVIIERTDENAEFYGEKMSVTDIFAGKVRRPPSSISTLVETLKAAQGDADVDEEMLPPAGEAPGDMEIEEHRFGIPDNDDPDPFGVKALEAEGVMIRESGTRRIPSIDTFDFRPSLRSPIHSTRSRWSVESGMLHSLRHSRQSMTSSVDRGTQTDEESYRPGSGSSASQISSQSSKWNASAFLDSTFEDEPLSDTEPPVRSSKTQTDRRMKIAVSDQTVVPTATTAVTVGTPTSPSFSRAKLVTIPKRAPPPLPPRNPERLSPGSPLSDSGRAGLLSPNSGYDEDMKSLQLTPSLQKENSQNFASTSREPTPTVYGIAEDDEESRQDKEVEQMEDKQKYDETDTKAAKEGVEGVESPLEHKEEQEPTPTVYEIAENGGVTRQDDEVEEMEDKQKDDETDTRTEEESMEGAESPLGHKEEQEQKPKQEEQDIGRDFGSKPERQKRQGGPSSEQPLHPKERNPIVQTPAEEEEEDEFKSPLEQSSPDLDPMNDAKTERCIDS